MGCYAARTGEGYWTCDVPGGCTDCRTLARELGDTDQIKTWDNEKEAAMADKCNAQSDNPDVRCHKEPHGEDENHWGLTPDGKDVVWASVTLRPFKTKEDQ